MWDPIPVTPLKIRPHYSQFSRENATPSSGTSPAASYKDPPPPWAEPVRCVTLHFEIGTEQLRSVTEIAPKSPFLRVNRSPIRYDFRACATATRYSVIITAWIWMWTRQNAFLSLNTASLIAKKILRKAVLKALVYISLICAISFIWRIIENTTFRCWILQKGSVVMNVEDFHRWGVTNSMKVLLKSKTAQSVLNTDHEFVARQWS